MNPLDQITCTGTKAVIYEEGEAPPIAAPPDTDPIVMKLANFWIEKTGNQACDFGRMIANPRAEAGFYRTNGIGGARSLTEIRQHLLQEIWHGYPLARVDWHLAIALELIPEPSMTYEKFYTERWHETAKHRSYYSPAICPTCREEAVEASAAAKPKKPRKKKAGC